MCGLYTAELFSQSRGRFLRYLTFPSGCVCEPHRLSQGLPAGSQVMADGVLPAPWHLFSPCDMHLRR